MRMHGWGRRLSRAAARLASAIGFSAGEQRLVLFLVGAFVAGFALKLAGIGQRPAPVVDYRQLDSVFAARSRAPAAGIAAGADTAKAETTPRGRLDINRADKTELMTLPGIGPTLAERIVAYRADAGRFATVNDLLKVKGIGRKKLERLAPLCTVNN